MIVRSSSMSVVELVSRGGSRVEQQLDIVSLITLAISISAQQSLHPTHRYRCDRHDFSGERWFVSQLYATQMEDAVTYSELKVYLWFGQLSRDTQKQRGTNSWIRRNHQTPWNINPSQITSTQTESQIWWNTKPNWYSAYPISPYKWPEITLVTIKAIHGNKI